MITARRESRPLVLSLKLGLSVLLNLGKRLIHLLFSSSLKQASNEKEIGLSINKLFHHIFESIQEFLNLNLSVSRYTNKKGILDKKKNWVRTYKSVYARVDAKLIYWARLLGDKNLFAEIIILNN